MTDNKSIINYVGQGLETSVIAGLVGCSEGEVKPLIDKALDELRSIHGSNLAAPILVELNRLDTLISVMTEDILEVRDEYCEVKGTLIRDSFTHRQKIADTIRKLVEAKVKLLQLSLTYKLVIDEQEDSKAEDTTKLTLTEKLAKFRDLLG